MLIICVRGQVLIVARRVMLSKNPWERMNARFAATENPCGSGLARESGGSGDNVVGWKTVFASKPAPTVGGAEHKLCIHP
jgi:hypothetical protein